MCQWESKGRKLRPLATRPVACGRTWAEIAEYEAVVLARALLASHDRTMSVIEPVKSHGVTNAPHTALKDRASQPKQFLFLHP